MPRINVPALKNEDSSVPPEIPARKPSAHFPIIGMGASAGGLEALGLFFANVPPGSGMAFVIVQHMDPNRKGLLVELLQRGTVMKVAEAKDRTRVRPDCIYVIPPNRDMSILHGVLHLFEPAQPRGLRLPIDLFFRSLAQDQQQLGIGVILSGMGTDGTQGLGEIKEKAGLGLAQEPATAKFDSMPRSVISAGVVDIVAPPEELPRRIIAYLARPPLTVEQESAGLEKTPGALDKILILLRMRTNHDFSQYKKNTIYRRIERRMGIHQIEKLTGYVTHLQRNPMEADLLFKELLIGVTCFFRDAGYWDMLSREVLPNLLGHQPDGNLRVWVAGCSTGEEAYSLAILFKELMEKGIPGNALKIQIFATDLDGNAIERARRGVFLENIAIDVSPERLGRFFTREELGYRVRGEIREMIIFSSHSLIMDPPFTRLDFISCRNLLIYLTAEIQKKIFPVFHYALKPGGVLFLGSAETIGQSSDLFTVVSGKCRVFRKETAAAPAELLEFPPSFALAPSGISQERPALKQPPDIERLAEKVILKKYAPVAVLVNGQGNILYTSGGTGPYLEPAAGKANWNVHAMAREGFRYELGKALRKAAGSPGPVVIRNLTLKTGAGPQDTHLTVERLDDSEGLTGLIMIVFTKAPPPAGARKGRDRSDKTSANQQLKQDLHLARLELQNTKEAMQASQEELRSTNEEIQSTYEEMQSTNEELTTSKEELQSLNEELQTVNAELQGKVDELSRSNNDMKNLLNSTEIATLFLDNELKIRRFTTAATLIIKLIPGDIGRPIMDLASELIYPQLPEDIREVLHKLGFVEKSVTTHNDKWFTVRIMPYRTLDDRIDGVVITFTDISISKMLEARLLEMQTVLEKRVAKLSKKKINRSGLRSVTDVRITKGKRTIKPDKP